MPANLPPDYFASEKRYRAAKTPGEKIACLEEMLHAAEWVVAIAETWTEGGE